MDIQPITNSTFFDHCPKLRDLGLFGLFWLLMAAIG